VRRVGKLPLVGLYYHTAAVADPDQAALLALSDILTRPGTGRLYKALVEPGLAVQVSSESEQRSEPGGLLVLTELRSGGDPAKVTQVMTQLIEELAQKGISPEELRRFQARALVNHERLLRSPGDLAHTLGIFATLGDYRLVFLQRDRIQKLTIDEVQQAAQRYLSRQNRTVGQFIPADQPPPKHARTPVEVSSLFQHFHGGPQVQPGEPFAQTPSVIAQRVITRKLATGMQLIMVPKKTRGQHVELALHLLMGSVETLRGKEAAIGLLAPLLLRGSKQHDHQQLLDELDRHKAELLASSESTLPGLVSPHLDMAGSTVRDELPALLGLLHEVLTSPGLAPAEFERIRQQALASCEDQTHNPMTQALIKLLRYSTPWPSSDPRYLPTTNEQIARLMAVKLDDLRTVANELLGGEHATLVLVGDFDPEAVSQQVTKLFSGFVAKRPFERMPRPFQAVSPSSLTVQLPDRDSSAVAALLPFALKDSDPDYPALLLWQQIFGGTTTARLNQRLRERDGLSYEVRSSIRIPTEDDSSYLAALATSAPQNGKAALTAIAQEIKLLLDKGPTQEELLQSQQGYDRQFDAMITDDDDLAMLLARLSVVGRDIRYLDELRAKVRKVTLPELLAAAQRHLRTAPLVSALTHE
jgi:zinc protease